MKKNCKGLQAMFRGGWFPTQQGEFIDAYNRTSYRDISGTILTKVDSGNHYWVAILKQKELTTKQYRIMANGKYPETIKALGHEYRLTIETRNGETYPLYIRQETDAQGKLHTYALEIRIRKLTPRECFRLMDVPDSRIDQLMQTHTVRKKRDGKEVEVEEQIVSNTQLYRQAGNSIVVSCLTHILDNIFYPKPLERASIKAFTQLELF